MDDEAAEADQPKKQGRSIFTQVLGIHEDDLLWKRPLPTENSDYHRPGPLHGSFNPELTIGQFLEGIINDNPNSDIPLYPGVRMLNNDSNSKDILITCNGIADGDILPEKGTVMSVAEMAQREQRLERESVQQDLAEGKTPNPDLCRKCRRYDLDNLYDREGKRDIQFGLFGGVGEIMLRNHCAIHRHILRIIACSIEGDMISRLGFQPLHPRLAAIDQEVQGTQLSIDELESGERVIGVRFGLRWVGAIRRAGYANWLEVMRQSPEVDLTGTASYLDPFERKDGQQVSIRLMRNWLGKCEVEHERKCGGEQLPGAKLVDIMLIDVADRCIVRGTSDFKYLALSYVWGKVAMFETNKSNEAARRIRGSLRSDDNRIPKTIRDAMILVQNLGERYLWVDAFCIVQDDSDNKHLNIRQMKQIYSSANATVVALTGQDANSGLPGVRPGSRPCQPVEWIGSDPLVIHPPLLSYVQETSHWFTRAWTFQEEMLSRRCLYFSEQYVYFQCSESVWTETGGELPLDWDDTGNSDFNPLLSLPRYSEEEYGPRAWKFEAYADLVAKYTQRQLSYQADILNAFSGSLEVFQQHFDSQILCGLPVAALDLALLWFQAEPLFRRRDARGRLIFPSWSWAGWEGPVRYTMGLVCRRDGTAYPTPSIPEYQTHHRGAVFKAKKRLQVGKEEAWYGRAITLHGVSGPDLGPNVLQFWAWTVPWANDPSQPSGFRVDNRQVTYLSALEHGNARSKQAVFPLQTGDGVHCGLLYLEKQTTPITGGPIEFVLISQLEDTDVRRRGPDSVEGKVRYFDEKAFPWRGIDSGIVNCLCVQWDGEIAERMAVVQVHVSVWKLCRPQWKHIRLG